MRLLIAYPNPYSYSETFIRDHIFQLKPVETLTGGWLPFIDLKGNSIFTGLLKIELVRGGLRRYFPTFYRYFFGRALVKFLRKNKIEVILAEYGITTYYLSETCKKLGIKLVAHFHGFDAFEHKTVEKFEKKYLEMSEVCSAIIVVSEDMKLQLVNLGISTDKIIVNSCGVDTDKFTQIDPSKNGNIIVFTGRFTAKKNPVNTIKAFAIVLEKIPDCVLWMIGDGELFDVCKTLVESLGIEKSVVFFGVKKPTEINQLLSEAKLFVQHSVRTETGDSEGTPVALLEAASKGLPIVSTRHGGIKQAVLENYNGFLVEEGDYLEMAEKIIYVISADLHQVKQWGENSRHWAVENYRMEKQINKIQEVLQNSFL